MPNWRENVFRLGASPHSETLPTAAVAVSTDVENDILNSNQIMIPMRNHPEDGCLCELQVGPFVPSAFPP